MTYFQYIGSNGLQKKASNGLQTKARFGKSSKKPATSASKSEALSANDLLQRMRERNRLMPAQARSKSCVLTQIFDPFHKICAPILWTFFLCTGHFQI